MTFEPSRSPSPLPRTLSSTLSPTSLACGPDASTIHSPTRPNASPSRLCSTTRLSRICCRLVVPLTLPLYQLSPPPLSHLEMPPRSAVGLDLQLAHEQVALSLPAVLQPRTSAENPLS